MTQQNAPHHDWANFYTLVFDRVNRVGWDAISMDDITQIARENDVDETQLRAVIPTKSQFLTAYNDYIDAKIIDNIGLDELRNDDLPVKERLFDILMERFECMAENPGDKKAIGHIIQSYDLKLGWVCDGQIKYGLERVLDLKKSMRNVLESIGELSSHPVLAQIQIKGLCLVFLMVLRVWLQDNSQDLSHTMVALDKQLSRADKFATYISGITG